MGQWRLSCDWPLSPPACLLTTPHFCSPAAQVSSPRKGAPPRPSALGPSLRFRAVHTRGQHVPTAPARPTWRAAVPTRLRMLPGPGPQDGRASPLSVLPPNGTESRTSFLRAGRVPRTDPGARVGLEPDT